LLEKEKKNMFFEFDVKEILKANIKERYEAYKLAKETGFMTLNEIRIAENMEFIEGMDVINVGLSAVLYDTNSHKYFTPNTNSTTDLNTQKLIEDKETDTDLNTQKLIEEKETDTDLEEIGNSGESERG
jgi:hypothetical protein